MAESLVIKQGDTAAAVRARLTDRDGPVTLQPGATVRFHMRQVHGTKTVTGTAITDPNTGEILYRWRADGTDTDTPGVYEQEWEVTFPDTTVATFPSDGWNSIVILEDLA